jgi:hypothetical protein
MIQLILHFWGDYITQNHWMLVNKTKQTWKGLLACWLHCFLYTLPFCFITHSPVATGVISLSHFFIDHFRLARYIVKLRDWNWYNKKLQPEYLSVWLLIIADNTLHVTINYLSLKYL